LGERWNSRKPEDVDAIVEGNDYDVLGVGEILAIIEWSLSIANIESYNALIWLHFWQHSRRARTSAIKPNEYRLVFFG
jgi:hypothetical protein